MIKAFLKKLINDFGYDISKKSKFNNLNDFIPEASDEEQAIMSTALKYSMTTEPRIWSLLQSIKHIKNNNIDGDIVECGVWRGGNIICASLLCKKLEMNKTLWAFDTYEGMTKPEDNDICQVNQVSAEKQWNASQKKESNTWCHSSLQEVTRNFITELGNIENIRMIKGLVEKTLDIRENIPEKIAVLRLDTDWYQSTKKELEVLYPKLQPNGVLIIDDYGHWQGARQAVDEYFQGKPLWFHRVDYSTRLIIKPQDDILLTIDGVK